MLNQTHRAVLRVLYALAQGDRHADLALVADELRLSCSEADILLADLDRAGLVDADRVRLTMTGLVLAVSTRVARPIEPPKEPTGTPELHRAARRSASHAA